MVVLILHRVPAVGSVILLPLPEPVISLWVAERTKDATPKAHYLVSLYFLIRVESYLTHSQYSE